jgi:hypothetical protein
MKINLELNPYKSDIPEDDITLVRRLVITIYISTFVHVEFNLLDKNIMILIMLKSLKP